MVGVGQASSDTITFASLSNGARSPFLSRAIARLTQGRDIVAHPLVVAFEGGARSATVAVGCRWTWRSKSSRLGVSVDNIALEAKKSPARCSTFSPRSDRCQASTNRLPISSTEPTCSFTVPLTPHLPACRTSSKKSTTKASTSEKAQDVHPRRSELTFVLEDGAISEQHRRDLTTDDLLDRSFIAHLMPDQIGTLFANATRKFRALRKRRGRRLPHACAPPVRF